MSGRKEERGTALLVVLVLVVGLAAIALAITQFTERTTRRIAMAQNRDQAYWAMIGIEKAALELLERQAQQREGVDLPSEEWLARPVVIPFEGGSMTARFVDRSACFNINDLVEPTGQGYETDPQAVERFGTLVASLGGTTNGGRDLAFAAADFMDSDGNAEPGGAEDYAYSGRDVPYVTAGHPLADISELRAVEGWSQGVMEVLAPWLCVRAGETGMGRLNLNTLTEEDAPLLANALGNRLPVGEAERVIAQRPPDGYEDVGQFLAQPVFENLEPEAKDTMDEGLGTEASLIELTVTGRYDGMEFVLTSLIEKGRGSGYQVTSRRFGPQD